MNKTRMDDLFLRDNTDDAGDCLLVEEDNCQPEGGRLYFDDMYGNGNGIFLVPEQVKELHRHLTAWLVLHGHRKPEK